MPHHLLTRTVEQHAQKRQVAMKIARGQTADAIKELNALLDTSVKVAFGFYLLTNRRYQTDSESWMQLADLYISQAE